MAKKNIWSKIGVWSYLAGLIIAIVVGVISQLDKTSTGLSGLTIAILAVLGVVVALLNISADEVNTFLLASIAFVVGSSSMALVFNALGPSFVGFATFMSAIVVFTAPGTLVVAFKALYNVAKDD